MLDIGRMAKEMEKVLIHEMIRLLDLDFNHNHIDFPNVHKLCNIKVAWR